MATPVKKSSWIVPLIASIAAMAVLVVWDTWFQPVSALVGFIAFALVALGFGYGYFSDTERMWWAMIVSMSALSLVGAMAADLLIGTDPANDWASVTVFGIGMAVTGVVLNRTDAKTVLYVIAMITLGVAALMAPIEVALKAMLVVVDVGVFAYVIAYTRGTTTTHGTPVPHG